MALSLIEYAEFNDAVRFFRFRLELPFLGKFGSRSQNYQFKLKFGTYSNSNIQNSTLLITFSVFDRKYHLWANLVQEVQIISLS